MIVFPTVTPKTCPTLEAGSVLTSSTDLPLRAKMTADAQAIDVLPTPPLPVKNRCRGGVLRNNRSVTAESGSLVSGSRGLPAAGAAMVSNNPSCRAQGYSTYPRGCRPRGNHTLTSINMPKPGRLTSEIEAGQSGGLQTCATRPCWPVTSTPVNACHCPGDVVAGSVGSFASVCFGGGQR